jgi:hypothetical protein
MGYLTLGVKYFPGFERRVRRLLNQRGRIIGHSARPPEGETLAGAIGVRPVRTAGETMRRATGGWDGEHQTGTQDTDESSGGGGVGRNVLAHFGTPLATARVSRPADTLIISRWRYVAYPP